MALRRWDDDILISNNAVEFSGFRWSYAKPIHRTITGVSVPQKVSVMERWWEVGFEFASDDPANSLERADTLFYDANNDKFFRFIDINGRVYKSRVMSVPEIERLEFPTAHVQIVRFSMKQDGHIR